MLHETTFDQFKRLAKQSDRVVVSKEIVGDALTPVRAFHALNGGERDAVLLDSSDHPTSEEACIYIGMDPVATFVSYGSKITRRDDSNTRHFEADPIESLRDFYQSYRCDAIHHLAKFAGGMIGYMAYDAVRNIEDIPDRHPNEQNIPDLLFKCYGTHLIFDKRTGKVVVTRIVTLRDTLEKEYQKTMDAIHALIDQVISTQSPLSASIERSHDIPEPCLEMDIDDAGYEAIVRKAQTYIAQGDIFQVVPSRRFQQAYSGDPFNIYRALRVLNPSPYQFFIHNRDMTIVGSSPERLVSLQHGIIETMPIAGTRPRGGDALSDLKLEQDLLNDEKEYAEHMMLVDLGRNDVGSISEPGSVKLVEKATIHKYSRVMHLVSRIQGQLREGLDCFDVLAACFPAGTLSGAPKIRAMEIIDDIETSRRGVYGGAIVAIDNAGQMDSCITIRTALVQNGIATVRVGAGIVLDSDPKKEAEETQHKAQAVFDAMAFAREGFV